jgi:sulfoxide reductase heme-binding subunit YedZ
MIAVFVSSLLRSRIKPGTWRALHWLAYGCWPVALAHTFGMGTDAGEHWVIALGALCVLSVGIALLVRVRAAAKQAKALETVKVDATPTTRLAPSSSSRGTRNGQ